MQKVEQTTSPQTVSVGCYLNVQRYDLLQAARTTQKVNRHHQIRSKLLLHQAYLFLEERREASMSQTELGRYLGGTVSVECLCATSPNSGTRNTGTRTFKLDEGYQCTLKIVLKKYANQNHAAVLGDTIISTMDLDSLQASTYMGGSLAAIKEEEFYIYDSIPTPDPIPRLDSN